jgi:hypothetical protein
MLDPVGHRSLPGIVIHRDTVDGRKRINVIDDYDGKPELQATPCACDCRPSNESALMTEL